MIKKVELTLLSPFISAERKLERNNIVTAEYISGSVLRAAFAKEVIMQCPVGNRTSNGRRNFVCVKDEQICRKCHNYEICDKFTEMRFSFFYPKDCYPIPMTSKVCKFDSSHGLMNMLLSSNDGDSCVREGCGGRLEYASGWYNVNEKCVFRGPAKVRSTHTAINYSTNTAMEHSLFTIEALNRGQVYCGCIDDKDAGLFKIGDIIYAGKYSSSGFGKLKVTNLENYKVRSCCSLVEDIHKFSARYKLVHDIADDRTYFSILFLSNAKLGFEQEKVTVSLRTEKYAEIWQNHLFGDSDVFTVENIYAQNTFYSGFDTSREWGKWRKSLSVVTLRGSVVVASYNKDDEDKAVKMLEQYEENGMSEQAEDLRNGYGKISICDELQMNEV